MGHNSDLSFSNFVSYLISVYNVGTSFFTKPFSVDKMYPAKVDRKTTTHIAQRLDRKHLLRKGSKYFDEHWAQFSTLCHPCHVNYDYIVKFETMTEDAAYVLTKLGPHNQCVKHRYPELFNRSETSSSTLNQYFSTLTPNKIDKLKKMYSIDFNLFGYKSSEIHWNCYVNNRVFSRLGVPHCRIVTEGYHKGTICELRFF